MSPEPTTVATVAHPDTPDDIFDVCYAWEAGQTYAAEGYVVTAVADDGIVDIATAQARYDYERALFIDCWAQDIPLEED